MISLLDHGWKYYDSVLDYKQRKLVQESISDIVSSDNIQSLGTFDPMRGNVIQHGDLEVYKELHEDLGNQLSADIGVKFNPSHTWRTIYLNNSFMVPHRDNEGFAFTLSIPIDSNIDRVVEERKFPFWVLDYENVIQGLNVYTGCGVFYYGKEIMHWRNPLIANDDSYVAQLMLSYRIDDYRQEDFSADKFYLDYDSRIGKNLIHRNDAIRYMNPDDFSKAISQADLGLLSLEADWQF